ncbi:septal ring lytic transglycosylase RlpA family protein [Bradyrhizobium sp. KBS0727]|uniref:septal ring lytic transglycosylase RlpA family protein n=1 Tax=unclassified Bradyrhizobium TaxID=2631580 RepID=UPI00110F6127|nr:MULTISPECIES: septal ring lytic transglycosylase RlpA family protein [unclassified Bradyrhizobium]QDW38993.1 septal ring lytic transglycosylase RlpA family protein [Bradyrhizobium sp. KBS0725]QDW45596.1 septal ring lytic transglycosylase RlpA family protein [Bradyrhizobium sp. KBS0727]
MTGAGDYQCELNERLAAEQRDFVRFWLFIGLSVAAFLAVALWPAAAGAAESSGAAFSGLASYYGTESGSRTASGQRFNQNAMTAAHRSLPFGTRLRVTYRGQSVVVTVNDRGPFLRSRILDLSTGAARAIGLTGAGVGRVRAEVLP